MKLLICGDSFSYNHNNDLSWVTQLSSKFETTNLSQCGCGQYKIQQQLKSVDLNKFDKILISHGSSNRLYINQPYALHNDQPHKHSDLLFTDVEDKKDQNPLALTAYNYFVNIFDLEYYAYIHNLICQDIDQMTQGHCVVHTTHFDYTGLYNFNHNLIGFYNIWKQYPGDINHYNSLGNKIVYDRMVKIL
jgi:hypothetical protein